MRASTNWFISSPFTERTSNLDGSRLGWTSAAATWSNELLQLIHENDNDQENPTFNGMVYSIFTTLGCLVMHGFKVGHITGGQASEPDFAPKKWPASTAALFPAGQEAAVVSFARFFRSTSSPAILDFIRTILPHFPSLAMPISTNALFWDVIIAGLEVAVDNFDGSVVGGDEESDGEDEVG
jgi:hypothetical protein